MEATDDAEFRRLVSSRLRGLHLQLEVVHAGVIVSAAALRHQNADQDAEIARVLSYCVGARVFEQIQCAAELLALLEEHRRRPGAR